MNELKNIFVNLKNSLFWSLNDLRQFIWKFRIASEIIFHIIKYYLEKGIYYIWFKFTNKAYKLELKSLLFIIFFSFLFYYFIVVELSILVFGYSLLCYWFLFIFVVAAVLVAWRLEAEFIKNEMQYDEQAPMQIWVNYYKNQDPLSFYDYLTDYENRPLFWYTVVNNYRSDIEDGRLAISTFFFFLIFFFFYSCAYRFDPWFVGFVAKYFFPVVNFFETWRNPRLEDFMSATIWFWNWLVTYAEATKDADSTYLKLVRKLPKPSRWLDDEANVQWSRKISLWKNIRFADIYFLWSVKLNPELWRLVFDLESPSIMATWFDPNWQLFFLWYMNEQFLTFNSNFWKWNFSNDLKFWQFLTNFSSQVNFDVNRVNNQIKKNYLDSSTFVNTSYELFLTENYFNGQTIDSNPLYEKLGSNSEIYENFINLNKINKRSDSSVMWEIFTTTPYPPTPLSLSGLRLFHKKYKLEHPTLKNKNQIKAIFNSNNHLFSSLLTPNIVNFNFSSTPAYQTPLYTFSNFETFSNLNLNFLSKIFSKPINVDQLMDILNRYNYWLSAVENEIGLYEKGFKVDISDPLTLGYLTIKINWRIARLENFLEKWGFLNFLKTEIPTFEEVKFIKRKYFKLSNFTTTADRKTIMGSLLPKESEKLKKSAKKKPILIKPSSDEIKNFLLVEEKLWILERHFNFWIIKSQTNFNTVSQKLKFPQSHPWYVLSLKYFSETEHWFVLPGFIRYYTPTPYPSTFTTFGFGWIKYQFFRKNGSSTVVGYSDSLSELKSSTPIALYSGVEAIIYIKPFLEVFNFFVKLFIKIITYPIEFIATITFLPLLNSVVTLAFFIHLVWFIHFYIYFFIAIYILYYLILYYHRKIGFLWFYEWMFEETFLSVYTNKIYWHSVNDIWINYKNPTQLYFFALHTNLLLHYTFFNYCQFFYVSKINTRSIISLLVKLASYKSFFINFLSFNKFFKSMINVTKNNLDWYIFWSFYLVRLKWYNCLLFTGGSDCSQDHLIWTYFDYLDQTSIFYNRALTKLHFLNLNLNELNSLIKQFIILISSMSLDTQYLFLANPTLDTILTRKLVSNLFAVLSNLLSKESSLLFFPNKNWNIFNYIFYLNYLYTYNNFCSNSSFDVYTILSNKNYNFLTKLGTNSFWNQIEYFILIFFWSFWFVPRIKFPFINLHNSHEVNRLRLTWIAYANSWIGQSMYVWPFYNLIQHIWWTSKLHVWSFGLINTPLNLNQSGLQIIDNVRNFYEKWYPYVSAIKVETVFGLVWTLNLTPVYYLDEYGAIPFVNKNFDLSFPRQTIENRTTTWNYIKTNPPLDLCELNITPQSLIQLFKSINPKYVNFYLSFFSQLSFMDSKFILLERNLTKEFKKLNLYQGLSTNLEHNFYQDYEFYLKEFDFEFQFSNTSIFSNWIFTFDISYFFTNFLTWDFFSTQMSVSRKSKVNWSSNIFNSSELNIFMTNFDMLAELNIEENWFKKPFGSLDKFELHALKKFKTIKTMDENSFTWHRDDPFLNLDTEHSVTEIGLAVYPKQDEKNLYQSYTEEFAGFWQKRFPYNPTIVKNSISPILVGWVGELYSNTITTTSLLYSLLYAQPNMNIHAYQTSNELESYDLLMGGKNHVIKTFFLWDKIHQELLVWSFTWLNIILHPSSHWYSFGPKALARMDYWSWKCGLAIDYKNGLYSYWPYLGFWHSFATKLTPYDPLYGFYNSYWQIKDNPLAIDLSIGVADIFWPKDDYEFIQDIKDSEKSTNPDYYMSNLDQNSFENFSLPYREIYYSFHHPYFLGYLFFWVLIYLSNSLYLGLVNFSYKWFLLMEFLTKNTLQTFTFNELTLNWSLTENWFWKQMFKYWIFYSNPLYLMSLTDCTIDDEIFQNIDTNHTMHNYYLYNSYLFSFLVTSFDLTTIDIFFLLDFKKNYLQTFLTNWLTLDLPFPLNPYLVSNWNKNLLLLNQLNFYQAHSLSFSHYDTLRENYNFNLFYDWSTGSYLDTINFISYLGCFKGTTQIHTIFGDNQSFLAASMLWLPSDKSKKIADDLVYRHINFVSHDLPLFTDLALHNLALLEFFQESLEFILGLETIFFEWKKIFHILKFYFKNQYFTDYTKYNVPGLFEIDSKISSIVSKKRSRLKQFFFFTNFLVWIWHDVLINALTTGIIFTNSTVLTLFYNSLRLRIFTRYVNLQNFFSKIGYFISIFFFKNL